MPEHTPPRTRRVAILMFDDVEALDFAGPYEVFTTASRVSRKRLGADTPAPFEVHTVARDGGLVRARAGLQVQVDHGFDTAPAADVLIVPGGVVDAACACPRTLAWLTQAAAPAELVASVCTGAFLLAAAGIVSDGPVTTHWEDLADLQRAHPTLDVQADRLWVDRGRIVTSAGIAAGIAMSLHLVARLAGADLATATARQLQVPWRDDPTP
jgi:transcriptional regulator GlxA family with amidase domain